MTTWQNRIVGYDTVDADQLLANPQNWRIHPKNQQDALESVLDTVGWVQDVVVNKRTQFVVDGHMRVALAISREQQVPVKYVDLTEEEEQLILATFDPISALAGTDAAQLDALLQSVNSDNAAVQAMLAGLAEDAGLYQDAPLVEAPDAQIDRAEELQQVWNVQRGQMWIIPSKSGKGEHRLLCGDSTNADDVARVMAGERADAVITDPPYGMNLNTEWGDREGTWDRNVKTYTPVMNDDKPFDRQCVPIQSTEEFWFGGDYYVDTLPNYGKDGSWLVWDKRQEGSLDDMRGNAFELCWSKKRHRRELMRIAWVGVLGHNKNDDGASKFHPTQKPVKLLKWLIETFTDTGSIVVDAFLGSGTIFVACEQTGRQGRGLEIEPKYCAVILQRMADMGLQPQLAEQP